MARKMRIAAIAAVFGLSATVAVAISQSGAAAPQSVAGATSSVVDFYGSLPPGVPVGP